MNLQEDKEMEMEKEMDNRAKSYARFTEGTSSYVLGRRTSWRTFSLSLWMKPGL